MTFFKVKSTSFLKPPLLKSANSKSGLKREIECAIKPKLMISFKLSGFFERQ